MNRFTIAPVAAILPWICIAAIATAVSGQTKIGDNRSVEFRLKGSAEKT
ncbi:secreted protein [Rhodopirellula baltica WH47]|uniref:Secreted protein n=1 Tax=Rhodopirellula baltica WH47 TaxID=991778 RepID=F2AN42_RHOBT|nr:secreted protein [Rhodopirellula baltica WH47]